MNRLYHNQKPVLLLGAEDTPALPVVWSLTKRNIPITVGSPRKISASGFSRYPVEKCVYPDPAAHTEDFVQWVLQKIQSGNFPVTMGCGEHITFLLSKNKNLFAPYTSIPVVDFETFLLCRNKALTMKTAVTCGVPIPATWFPEEDGIEKVAADAAYPAILKPCFSHGAIGISAVDTPDELISVYNNTRALYGPCIVQEFIPHDGKQYKAELLLDKTHKVKMWGSYAKLRFYPPTGGSSTLNQTVYRKDILDYSENILSHMKWWGMGDCDFIIDPRDGIAKLMEINPRITRTIRILVDAGLDFPYALYRLALGLELHESKHFATDIFLRYLPADIAWFIRSKKRFRAEPSFFRFFAKNLHYEEWSWHDPLTGLGLWLLLLKDMIDPQQRKKRFYRRT